MSPLFTLLIRGRPDRAKQRAVTTLQRYLVNPAFRGAAGRLPGTALLETRGRRSGRPRHTPVGGRLEGQTFWFVSEYGRRSQYVRNIEADPRVRLRIGGRWQAGSARLLPEDDPKRRLRRLGLLNSALVRLVGTELCTVRVDLEGPAH